MIPKNSGYRYKDGNGSFIIITIIIFIFLIYRIPVGWGGVTGGLNTGPVKKLITERHCNYTCHAVVDKYRRIEREEHRETPTYERYDISIIRVQPAM
jgi:hypothetical protein